MAGKKQSTKQKQIDEIIRAGRSPDYFLRNYAKIQHPRKGLIPFELYPFQTDCLEDFVNQRLNVILKSRQLGISTVTAGFALWLALFYKHQSILVIATKREVAMGFVKKVKTMLKSLPPWLVLPNVVRDNLNELEFSHGSSIKAIPTSDSAGRSESLSLLILDECIDGNTKLTIRNKYTNEVKEVRIEELMNDEYK